MNQVESATVFA